MCVWGIQSSSSPRQCSGARGFVGPAERLAPYPLRYISIYMYIWECKV